MELIKTLVFSSVLELFLVNGNFGVVRKSLRKLVFEKVKIT